MSQSQLGREPRTQIQPGITVDSENPLIFAQITDIHVGSETLSPVESAHNLRWALQEIGELEPQPACILATGDLVDHGSEADLEEYARLITDSRVPIYALPANHDLWGEQTTEPYERLVGPLRRTVDRPGRRRGGRAPSPARRAESGRRCGQ